MSNDIQSNTNFTIFDTFVTSTIILDGFISLGYKRWASLSGLDKSNIWMLPLNIVRGSFKHWALFIVVFSHKTIFFIDSLHGDSEHKWLKFLCNFIETYRDVNINWQQWTFVVLRDIPTQFSVDGKSWDNCGIHVCTWMYIAATGRVQTFSEADMNNIRKLIATILAEAHIPKKKQNK